MMADAIATRFSFTIDGYDGEVRVPSFTGHEAISELFCFSIELAISDDAIDFSAIVGAKATLSLHRDDTQRDITGIISRLEQRGGSIWHTSYNVELVPLVWLLTQRHDCRIFQDKTAPEIIDDVFSRAGLSDAIKPTLRGQFPKRVYCVQYRETDWNFVSRLMEEEGIYYFFDTAESGTTLIIANTPEHHLDISGEAEVPYHSPTGMEERHEWVFDMSFAQRVRSGKVSLRDYNFTTPSLALHKDKTTEKSRGGNAKLEIYDYPGLYEVDDNGARMADIRLQSLLARVKELSGQSTCRRLATGHKFELVDAPRSDFNGKYVLTHIEHVGRQPVDEDHHGDDLNYENSFRAIPIVVPFRPLRVTPKPVVEGVQTAVVTGPGGEEIYTDSYGRVKVQFPWDREGQKNDKSSCWMRVAQISAGASWGAVWIPRIGFEVVVQFIEGDPDRPIIIGSVYNAANMPPYPLDAEKTKSTIKSNSSKGGGGFNEYRFEDKKGSEEIYQHGQKDLTIVTNNDKNQSTGHDETLKIGNDRSKDVGNNETTKIGVDRTEEVGSNEMIKIGANRTEDVGADEKITIGANRTEEVGANESITITGNRTEKVSGNESIDIAGNRDSKIGGNDSIKISGDQSEEIAGGTDIKISGSLGMSVGSGSTMEVTGAMSQTISETFNCEAKDSVVISSEKDIAIKCGKAEIILKKDGSIFINGKDIKIDGSGKLDVKAAKDMILKAKKILQN